MPRVKSNRNRANKQEEEGERDPEADGWRRSATDPLMTGTLSVQPLEATKKNTRSQKHEMRVAAAAEKNTPYKADVADGDVEVETMRGTTHGEKQEVQIAKARKDNAMMVFPHLPTSSLRVLSPPQSQSHPPITTSPPPSSIKAENVWSNSNSNHVGGGVQTLSHQQQQQQQQKQKQSESFNASIPQPGRIKRRDGDWDSWKSRTYTAGTLGAVATSPAPTDWKRLTMGSAGMNGTFTSVASSTHGRTMNNATFMSGTLTPVAETIEKYLAKEVQLARGSSSNNADDWEGCDDAVLRLRPYRETLLMMGEAMPAYARVIQQILNAVDRTISMVSVGPNGNCSGTSDMLDNYAMGSRLSYTRHSERLSLEKGGKQRSMEGSFTDTNSVLLLHRQIDDLKDEVAALDELLAARSHRNADDGESGIASEQLKSQLKEALQAVSSLETEHASDLSKILCLIATVREDDRRMRELEHRIAEAGDCANELQHFKHLSAELESDLRSLAAMHSSCVPESRLNAIQHQLQERLTDSVQSLKDMRRIAAIRGTQVDVLERRVEQLSGSAENASAPPTDRPLTPRPNWQAIQEQLPELKEFSAPIASTPISGTDTLARTIPGPTETGLRVEYLVDRLKTLLRVVPRMSTYTRTGAELAATGDAAHPIGSAQEGSGGGDGSNSPTGSGKSAHKGKLPGTHNTAQSPSRDVASRTDYASSTRVALPILGRNFADVRTIPSHLRVYGTVPRTVFDAFDGQLLVLEFFQGVLLCHPSALSPTLNISQLFVDFITEKRSFMSSLADYACAEYAVINFVEDALEGGTLAREPCAQLLSRLLDGSIPARVAIDALAVVNHIREEVDGFAKEQRKTRLRRQVISELIVPALHLKSSSEMSELRMAIGADSTYDVEALMCSESCFIRVLFNQECAATMTFYADVVANLTTRATVRDGVIQVLSKDAVTSAVLASEPQTPLTIVDEIFRAASSASQASPALYTFRRHIAHRPQSGTKNSRPPTAPAQGRQAATNDVSSAVPPLPINMVYLGAVIHALAAAPLTRRSRRDGELFDNQTL